MELKIENNKLIMNGKKTKLTDEQLKELGIKESLFVLKKREKCYVVDTFGDVIEWVFIDSFNEHQLLNQGKMSKNKKIMEQKALHQNLNDLLWKFTIENGWNDELWEDCDMEKYYIYFDYHRKIFGIDYNMFFKKQGTIYFISEEIAQRAIDEIVKPYMEEHPEFVW